MSKKTFPVVEIRLEHIVGGGQTIGTYEDGRKIFVWGGLPGELVRVQVTKKKSRLIEGVVVEVLEPSIQRIAPVDPDSYLSTSPWQIMSFEAEQHYKSALIEEAFELHDIVLPEPITIYSDGKELGYRNKVEFSWYWDKEREIIDLAFFRRGTHGKIPVEGTSLAHPHINSVAEAIRDLIRKRSDLGGFQLKTLLIRCDQHGAVVAQLYAKDRIEPLDKADLASIEHLQGFEAIYSDPRSPASVRTDTIQTWGDITLNDHVLDVDFHYATEGFFQINIPVYEQALRDMRAYVDTSKPTLDMYSGVGSIGLTIGSDKTTLVELNPAAVTEMRRNIAKLGRENNTKAVEASSETALEYITADKAVILDPPRAGLHADVVERLLQAAPERIIYLSCNPVTQVRDIALLATKYGIRAHKGYNFFPRTPHIEHLVILDKK